MLQPDGIPMPTPDETTPKAMPTIPDGAVGVRITRALHTTNEFRNFEPVIFVDGRSAIDTLLRRLRVFGMFDVPDSTRDSECLVDFIDDDEMILGTFFVTPRGFKYLRQQLRVKVEVSHV